MTEKFTYERLVEECKRLRTLVDKTEVSLFVFLMKAEREYESVWRDAGCASFAHFLQSNCLPRFDRYRFFAMGVDRVGLDAAQTYGVHWTCAAGRMDKPSKAALADFIKRAAAFLLKNHVAPSEESVRVWAAEVSPARDDEPKVVREASELARLRARVQELEAKLAAAEKTIAELKRKLKGESRPRPS